MPMKSLARQENSLKLKYLELYGFKSFAGKTKFQFNNNFVGIVGPNGSGKSNTSDAIRWVLGEQSAKALRGSKMEDVIFAGTESKSPMNMAQVIIGFDNSDHSVALPYEEVTVSRKVYRSGESEYYINQSLVRRKDIRDLFFDTGIGKEGYSIIGQGRIDDILSSKSEDRRAIFEEASGISKYKFQKMESVRRLERTETSLESVVSDLKVKKRETQLLKTQADNAKKGYILTRELEQHELSLLQNQVDQFNNKKDKSEADLKKLISDISSCKEDLNAVTNELLPYQDKIQFNNDKKFENAENIRKFEAIIQKRSADKDIFEEQIRFYAKDIERITEDLEKRNKQKSELEKSKLEIQKTIEELKQKKESLNSEMEAFDTGKDSDFDDFSKLLSDKKIELEKIQEKLVYLEADKKNRIEQDLIKREDERKAREALNNLDEDIDKLEKEKGKKEKSFNQKEKELLSCVTEIESKTDKKRNVSEKIQLKEVKINELKNEYSALQSSQKLLQALIDNYEGYQRSVQQFLIMANKDKSIKERYVGVLADLISVKAPYETAVEVCMGNSLQNIVVETENDAKFLIEYLKKNKLGRITFLPIERIREEKAERLNYKEELINASEAISCDNSIRNIISHFLARTSIVEDIDSAISLSHKKHGNRIVSLDGDIINSWGSMVGGSIRRNKGNIINRQEQLQDGKIKLDKMDKDISKLVKEIEILIEAKTVLDREISDLYKNREDLQSEISIISSEKMELNINLRTLSEKKLELVERASKSEGFFEDDYIVSKEKLTDERDSLNFEIQSLIEKTEKLRDINQEKEKKLLVLKNQSDFADREFLIALNRLSDCEERIEFIDKQNEEEGNNKTELEEKKISNERSIELFLSEISTADNELEVLNKESERLNKESYDFEIKLKDKIDLKRNLEFKLSEFEKEEFQKKVQLENIQNQLNQVYENYREQYDLSLEIVEERLKKNERIATSRAEVTKIKQELNQIGYFNFDTIEEYENLKEEVNFLSHQLEDLEKSKADIEEMITDLDQTMKSMFSESFKKINEKYDVIFKILFEGGHAELVLDSDDILNAGIEIAAQPPGKKLQSLDLLSGGERSMTALALLFAIFAIRPTPFCILDEIDASLDEANIGRYVKYLQTLTNETQFVVITHRKTTMELADMLYGVTMEKGISKVVTLRFEDYGE